jgi:hypothetical protein
MKPIGFPPALNRATLTKVMIPAATGADTDVPAAANRPPAAIIKKLDPAAAISGYPLPVPNPGTGALLVPATDAKY